MLRGAIELATPVRVSGWIYTAVTSMEGLLVQAFVDSECVGEGTLGLPRDDLAAAGLGDGRCGFSFPISLAKPADRVRLHVRLFESDFMLTQPNQLLMPAANTAHRVGAEARWSAAAIEWLRRRGALEQYEVDLLTGVNRFGVYSRSLRVPKMASQVSHSVLLDAHEETGRLLDLISASDHRIETHDVAVKAGLREATHALVQSAISTVAVLHAMKPVTLLVVEGSHVLTSADVSVAGQVGAIEYECGPDSLIVLDTRCMFFGDEQTRPGRKLTVSFATLPTG